MSDTSQSHVDTSLNWSGGYTVASNDRRFTYIGGRWTVPVPQPPADGVGGLTDGDYRVSTWIGLDGYYLRSHSLPQAGTTQAVVVNGGVAGPPTYSAWFQWWVRGQLYPPVIFSPAAFPVAGGDDIICLLAVDAGGASVRLLLVNTTSPWKIRWKFLAPPGTAVEGSTAEWIVERPENLAPPYKFYPLPDYGQFEFRQCDTAAAPIPPLGVPGNLKDSRRIRMNTQIKGPPYRSKIISIPRKIDNTTLRTRYR